MTQKATNTKKKLEVKTKEGKKMLVNAEQISYFIPYGVVGMTTIIYKNSKFRVTRNSDWDLSEKMRGLGFKLNPFFYWYKP